MVLAGSMIRGAEYVCENCGSGVRFSGSLSHARSIMQVTTVDESTSFDVMVRPDGPWVFLDKGEESILETLDFDSDRAVAIATGSMIETRLERAIRNRFQRDNAIEERFFSA
jgi:hypothetical protein